MSDVKDETAPFLLPLGTFENARSSLQNSLQQLLMAISAAGLASFNGPLSPCKPDDTMVLPPVQGQSSLRPWPLPKLLQPFPLRLLFAFSEQTLLSFPT